MDEKMSLKRQQLEKYKSSGALSQSDLTLLDQSPFAFKNRVRKDESYFVMGTMVDTMLTLGEEYLFIDTIVLQQIPPTGQMLDFIKNLVALGAQIPIDKHLAQDAYIMVNTKKYKIDYFLEELEKKHLDYFIELLQSKDKTVVSYEQFVTAKTIVQNVLEDKYTSSYFNNDNYYYQYPLYSRYEDVYIKGLLDIIEIDEKNKTARVVDLKTTSKSVYNFEYPYLAYRYDLQGSYYYNLLKDNFKDYEILPTRFIVVETEYMTNPPIIYEMSYDEINAAKVGRKINNKYYKGWSELIEEYKIRNKTDNWKYPVGYDKKGGVCILENLV